MLVAKILDKKIEELYFPSLSLPLNYLSDPNQNKNHFISQKSRLFNISKFLSVAHTLRMVYRNSLDRIWPFQDNFQEFDLLSTPMSISRHKSYLSPGDPIHKGFTRVIHLSLHWHFFHIADAQ